MKRETVRQLLTDLGITSPTDEQVTKALDVIHEDRKKAVADAVADAKKEFDGYVSGAEHKKVADELTALKNSQTKSTRLAKLKDLGIAEKFLEHADSIIGTDEKGYDDRVKKYKEDYPELLAGTKGVSFQGADNKGTGSDDNTGANSDFNKSLRAALGCSE